MLAFTMTLLVFGALWHLVRVFVQCAVATHLAPYPRQALILDLAYFATLVSAAIELYVLAGRPLCP